jgi:hypothetical protein
MAAYLIVGHRTALKQLWELAFRETSTAAPAAAQSH